MPEATSRERKPKNNSRQTAVLGGQTRACQKNKNCQSSSTVLYSLSGTSQEGEKRRGAFRCKREGYALFKASHVQDVKYNFSDGNECEPFDSNFSNDSHLLISHSVFITPGDNPKGNQEKQFEADCQEEPTKKNY